MASSRAKKKKTKRKKRRNIKSTKNPKMSLILKKMMKRKSKLFMVSMNEPLIEFTFLL
jgi:hypothetical protein